MAVSPLLHRLAHHAQTRPNDRALVDIDRGETWSWRQLQRATHFLVDHLPAEGVVILGGANEPAFVAAFLGILGSGCDVFCVSPDAGAAELEKSASAAGCRRLDIPFARIDEMRNSTASHGSLRNQSGGLLLHSSGTTGMPNIVRRSGPSLGLFARALCRTLGLSTDDQVLAMTPLCHSYGLEHCLLGPLWAGSCTHLSRRFDAAIALREIQNGITIFPAVPFMFEALSQADEGAKSTLRLAYSAGGPLSAICADLFAGRHGIKVGQVYGTTEVGSATFGVDSRSVGRPMEGVDIHIDLETSQIAVRTPWMFDGYLGQPPHPGHFLTGDLGRYEKNENLFITGRSKLIIDIGGRKVNPLEVERVLADHPDVGQCVVLPMAVSQTVTRLRALVTPRRAARLPSPAELRRFVKERLASYKVPRVFEVRDQLPVSPTGKILRHLIEG